MKENALLTVTHVKAVSRRVCGDGVGSVSFGEVKQDKRIQVPEGKKWPHSSLRSRKIAQPQSPEPLEAKQDLMVD